MKRTLAPRPTHNGLTWPRSPASPLAEAELAPRAARQLCPPGLTLLRQGLAAQEVYVVRQGLVKLLHTAANGHECVLGLRTAGEWLGCAAVTLQEAAFFSAVTLTECELYRLPLAAYLDWFHNDAAFAWQQHRAQSRELLNHWQQAADFVCVTARQRLEQTLWQFAQAHLDGHRHRNLRLQLPLQQQELAGWLAITPSHLSRLYKELEEAKLLRREKGWLVLPAPDKLWRGKHDGPRHDSKGADQRP
jgi:CRP-like cAMP-binding protein